MILVHVVVACEQQEEWRQHQEELLREMKTLRTELCELLSMRI